MYYQVHTARTLFRALGIYFQNYDSKFNMPLLYHYTDRIFTIGVLYH